MLQRLGRRLLPLGSVTFGLFIAQPTDLIARGATVSVMRAISKEAFPGKRIMNFGDDNGQGRASKGIVIETAANADVLAPAGGRVIYVGDVRCGTGRVVIMALGGHQHLGIAGLARVDVAIGDYVTARDHIGLMPRSTAFPPRLYVELRRNWKPIDPEFVVREMIRFK